MLHMRASRIMLFEQLVCPTRQLDFRSWFPELKDEVVDRFLAAFALLFTPNVVESVDVNTAGLVEAPGMLRCLPGLLHLDISGNRGLMSLSPLRTCSQLRTVNLSGCSSLSDIAVLGQLERLEGIDLSHCSALVDATLLAIGGQPPRGYECCAGPELMGHPALQWLSFSCCHRLDRGLDAIALCQNLEFVDLWGCDAAAGNVAHCIAIWRNVYPPMTRREVVWPHRKVVEEASSLEGWSEAEFAEAFSEAQHSVDHKLLRALRLPSGTGAIGSDSRKKAQLQSAVDAGHEFEVESSSLIEAENTLEALNYKEPSPPAQRKRPAHLAPESFCRGLRAIGINSQTLNGTQVTDVFNLLDIDDDGHVEWDEFLRLNKKTATLHELGVLHTSLLDHFGSEDAILSELSKSFGNPEDFTAMQLSKCFVAAGVSENLADRTSNTLLAAIKRSLEDLTAAIDACKTIRLLHQIHDFRSFLLTFKSIETAFYLLDKNKSGSVSLEEFTRGLDRGGALAWRPAEKDDKIATVVFDILDQDKSGVVGLKEFLWLQDFSLLKTFQELSAIAVAAERHCSAVPKAFRPASAAEKKQNARVPFRDFLPMWKIIGQNERLSARTCFCLLDANVSGSLCLREWLAFKAVPHIKVSQDAATLGEKLCSHFAGGLQEAFQFIFDSDNAPAPSCETSKEQAP
jgi:Ca2+-binding EF-hand superfamily protein